MRRFLTIVVYGLVGGVLGALGGRILFDGSPWNLVPWAAVAIAIGLVVGDRLTAVLASAVYGYLLVIVFLYVANTGNAPLAERVFFALALGLVGPVCSIVLTLTGRLIRLKLIPRRRPRG